MALSVAVAALGIWVAWRIYGANRVLEGGSSWAERFPAIHRLLVNKYWVDEIYDATFVRGTWAAARNLFRFDATFIDGFLVHGTRNVTIATSFFSGFFDKYVVDGLVNLTAWVLKLWSRILRAVQGGVVSQYALIMAMGVFAMVCLYIVFLG